MASGAAPRCNLGKNDRKMWAVTTGMPISATNYAVKSIEMVADDGKLRARLYVLAVGDIIPWHFHSEVTDWYFCLGGTLRIELRAPDADERITAGGCHSISPGTAHRISNGGDGDCRFLLLQGVGAYDFNRIGD